MGKWEILNSHYLFRRKWMNVREDRVRLPNGVTIEEFHVLEYPDWVCILPLTDDYNVVLVEHYRHGIGRLGVEFPAGVVDPGVSVEAAARRELVEETGYEASEFVSLGAVAPEPSRHSNFAHIMVASGATRVREPKPDDNEVITVRRWPIRDLVHLLEEEQFVHSVHSVAILRAHLAGLVDVRV